MTAAKDLHLDIEVDIGSDETVKAGATEIIAQIRPEWKDQLGFKIFTEGITNKLVGVFNASRPDRKYHEMVLIRCYGYNSDLLIDRQAEIRNMKLMHKSGIGAELYATFRNGLAYEFLAGSTLTKESVVSPKVFPKVAKAMKKLHEIPLENGDDDEKANGKSPCLWRILRKFHAVSPDGFPEDPEKDARYKEFVYSKAQLLEEIEKMEADLRPEADDLGKVVFCHNDALLENVVLTDDEANNGERGVAFIDYEYGDANYREYDIADHFSEFVGVDVGSDQMDYENLLPSKDFQLLWIKEYLGSNSCDDQAVEQLQRLVDRFAPLPNLMWGIWALIQAKHSNIDFDFLDYAIQRLNQYKKVVHPDAAKQ